MNNNLSDEQLKIVNDWDNNILLTAIPGSGKTKTIISKIIEQLKNRNDNKLIVAITYTNRAAEEMKERIYNEFGETEQIFIGTIHSFCYEYIFKRNYNKFDCYSDGFKIISEEQSYEMIKEISANYNLEKNDKDKILFNRVDTTINSDGSYNEKSYKMCSILTDFYKLLESRHVLNFNLLLYLSFYLLNSYKYIARNLKLIISSIYVDEYQDTNQLQYDILSEIYKSDKIKQQLILVGDSNQAIYSSLGSVIKDIDDLKLQFGCSFIKKELTGCYRSYKGIIDYYKEFAINKIDMISKIGSDFNTIIKHYNMLENNMYSEVVSIINNLLILGVPESNICIMAPWWYLLLPISDKLRELMPNIKFDAPEISPIKRNDDLPLYNLSKLICMRASHDNINYKRHLVIDFKNKFKDVYKINLEINIDEFLSLVEARRVIEYEKGIDYLSLELKFFLKEYFNVFNEEVINDYTIFISEVSKRMNDKRYKFDDVPETFMKMFNRREGIVVSTCHGVKGEEYDAIICLYVNEGKIPHFTNADNRIEAKRLLFVMFSRARKYIHVFSVIRDFRDVPTKEIAKYFID